MSTREGSWEGVPSRSGRKLLSPRSRFVCKGRKKKTKDSGMRITKGYLWRETSMKGEKENKVYVCIRRTRPSLNIFFLWSCEEEQGTRGHPSSFCQAGTMTTAGDP